MQDGIPGWYNHYTAVGGDWARMLISGEQCLQGPDDGPHPRRSNARTRRRADLLDEFFDFLIEEGGSVSTVYDHHTEKDMNLAMSQPWCSIGSDGRRWRSKAPCAAAIRTRAASAPSRACSASTFAKGLLQLEDAVRKMTSQNAGKLSIFDRGLFRARACSRTSLSSTPTR